MIGIGIPVMAVLAAAANTVVPRHPKVMAWRKRRHESRILGRVGLPEWFLTGPMPAHDTFPLTDADETAFTWISCAIRASQNVER